MAQYCEVALPVPLDRTFTYAVRPGQAPQRGARVIAPFRNEKLIGVVTAVGGQPDGEFETRHLEAVLDDEPLLSAQLLELAEWIAGYYLAPLGEVLRGMLPLVAEVRRTVYYRIMDAGRDGRSTNPSPQSRDLGHPAQKRTPQCLTLRHSSRISFSRMVPEKPPQVLRLRSPPVHSPRPRMTMQRGKSSAANIPPLSRRCSFAY
jgi:primosomal protein N'